MISRFFSTLLEPKKEVVFCLLRAVVGVLFAFHGVQKIFGILTTSQPSVGSQLWVGGLIELATGFAVALGVYTRPAALLASGTMAVAYTQFHWQGAFDRGFFPVVNQGELAVVYAFVFLYIACRGPGPYSVDRR